MQINNILKIIGYTLLATITTNCATIIGGNASTKRTSGASYGPATIADENTSLTDDKFSAITITHGDLNLTNAAVAYKLNVFGDLIINNSNIKGTTQVGGMLNSNNSNFYQSCGILGNINAQNSYFSKSIEFAGESMVLSNNSKIIGNIISTSITPVTITIDHSKVKGTITFANSNSLVIIRNKGYLTGKIINGKVQDLTNGDSYGGDDE